MPHDRWMEINMFHALPSDFIDRPRFERWGINLLVLLKIKKVKMECCESFRKGKNGKLIACKGCPTRYDTQSNDPVYRFLARHAAYREPKTKN